jgi:nitrogen fixation/metabolism regulation signal transduction histidine kinase
MHEIKALIHELKMNAKRASEAYRIRNNIEEAVNSINEVRNVTKDFESWFQVTIGSTRADKRTRQKVNIVELISKCIESWGKSLGNDIEFKTSFSEDEIPLVCFPYEIDSIFHNLISNSYKSFKRGNTVNKKISVSVTHYDGKIKISYFDNGVGLSDEFKENPDIILKQMVTGDIVDGQKQGTGLGMWIVNNIIMDYKGKIDLSKNIKSENGFYIDIVI